ncbi:MAG: GTPase domain-containing protein [Acidobacteriota bacterium]
MHSSQAHHAAINDLLELIRSSVQAIEDFPDLQRTPSPRLGISLKSAEAFEEKRRIFQGLTDLRVTLDNISKRIEIPTLVGVIGKYSSGKSSLLNAFFHHIFAGEPPEELRRQVGATSVDTRFTYITHSGDSGHFQESKNLDVTTVDHPFFQELNFIDTPGTGWEAFTERGISNLLSAADVMLFLFKPTEVLDALSVEALAVKIRYFPETPTIFVVTGADQYTEQLDWSTLDLQRFADDLKAARKKLEQRDCRDEEEARARDLVVKNIDFAVGGNTFLVDARYRHRTEKLLRHVQETFGSELKKSQKQQQLDQQIRSAYRRFSELVARAEHHIRSLMSLLSQMSNTVIKADVSRFKSTAIASAGGALSRKAHTQLSQHPLNLEVSHLRPIEPLALARGYKAPELTLLNRHLEDLRQGRRKEGFELKKPALLFNARDIETDIENLKLTLIKAIVSSLDARWESAAVLAKLVDLRGQGNDLEELVRDAFDSLPLADLVGEYSEERALYLAGHFDDAALGAAAYYDGADIKKTIFNRHAELMENMSLSLPQSIKRILRYGNMAAESAKAYVKSNYDGLATLTRQSSASLKSESFRYLNDFVYLPTKEALDFLFADGDGGPRSTDEFLIAEMAPEPTYQFDSEENLRSVIEPIEGVAADFVREVEQEKSTWQKRRDRLEADSNLLIDSSRKTSGQLKTLRAQSSARIQAARKAGIVRATQIFGEYREGVRKLARDRQNLIEDALASAKKTNKRKVFAKWATAVAGHRWCDPATRRHRRLLGRCHFGPARARRPGRHRSGSRLRGDLGPQLPSPPKNHLPTPAPSHLRGAEEPADERDRRGHGQGEKPALIRPQEAERCPAFGPPGGSRQDHRNLRQHQ